MKTSGNIVALWPRWMENAGMMLRMKALVRSRCCQCGTLMRVEMEDVVARHGANYSLVDKLERCRMVECYGSTFYLASRTYGAVDDAAARTQAARRIRGAAARQDGVELIAGNMTR
jgi:hypothetical protein